MPLYPDDAYCEVFLGTGAAERPFLSKENMQVRSNGWRAMQNLSIGIIMRDLVQDWLELHLGIITSISCVSMCSIEQS